MASTFTHTGPNQPGSNFLDGFDQRDIVGQVHLFQIKTNDHMLENYIFAVEYDKGDPSMIAAYLENYPRHSLQTDPTILNKAVELGAAYRAQHVR